MWTARVIRFARSVRDDLLDVVFPPRCGACEVELEHAGALLCPLCRAGVVRIGRRGCRRCGGEPLPGAAPGPARCRRCSGRSFAFTRATAGLRYAGAVRALVLGVKFGGRREGIPWLAEQLVEALRETGLARRAGIVVPVPLHPFRRMGRGFDQAELLAACVAAAVDRPLVRHALRRRRWHAMQTRTAPGDRGRNVQAAFRGGWTARQVRGRAVLLVDDVLSTGATADAAARALLASGARVVLVAAAAT